MAAKAVTDVPEVVLQYGGGGGGGGGGSSRRGIVNN